MHMHGCGAVIRKRRMREDVQGKEEIDEWCQHVPQIHHLQTQDEHFCPLSLRQSQCRKHVHPFRVWFQWISRRKCPLQYEESMNWEGINRIYRRQAGPDFPVCSNSWYKRFQSSGQNDQKWGEEKKDGCCSLGWESISAGVDGLAVRPLQMAMIIGIVSPSAELTLYHTPLIYIFLKGRKGGLENN